ncbi:DUF447 domain-containing protein [Neorhodopirellula lusitana]|uniref:DUF447 domain-containing protein n=1 Tax=Neorhodopirellula lusitana TaxID=445327 RepID=UPI00384A6BD2
MILESIITTISADGEVNIAPLGPIVLPGNSEGELPSFCLRPYEGSRTCANLLSVGKAVINVTDDVLLLAKSAIGHVSPDGLVCAAEGASKQHMRLKDCHRWFAVDVIEYSGTPPRHEMLAKCISEGIVGPFFGFNRAKHAVIEAAILATRIGLIDSEEVLRSISELRIPVEKTSGPDEAMAFELVVQYIQDKLTATTTS